MAYADAQDEATWIRFSERPGAVGHRHRVAGVDVRDARTDDQPVRRCEQDAGVAEELLAPDALRNPDDGIALRLELPGCLARVRRRQPLEGEAPHPDTTEFLGHASTSVATNAAHRQVPFMAAVCRAAGGPCSSREPRLDHDEDVVGGLGAVGIAVPECTVRRD